MRLKEFFPSYRHQDITAVKKYTNIRVTTSKIKYSKKNKQRIIVTSGWRGLELKQEQGIWLITALFEQFAIEKT